MLRLVVSALVIRWLWPMLRVLAVFLLLPVLYALTWIHQNFHIAGFILFLVALLGFFFWACRAHFDGISVKTLAQNSTTSSQLDSAVHERERQQHKDRMAVYRAEAQAEIERLRKSPDYKKPRS
jgi:hypothetical protein